jgi:hypothetical protein
MNSSSLEVTLGCGDLSHAICLLFKLLDRPSLSSIVGAGSILSSSRSSCSWWRSMSVIDTRLDRSEQQISAANTSFTAERSL